MKSKTLSLFRTTLQSNFDSPRAKKRQSQGKGKSAEASGKSRVGGIIFALLIGSAILSGIYYVATLIYDKLEVLGRQDMFVDLIPIGLSITLLGFGFMFVMQEMYHSKDIAVYMYLPIKKSQILTFRFIKVLIMGGLISAILLIPFVVAYGVKSSAGLEYIPYAFLILLLLPIIPLTVVGLISMLLMRFTAGLKSKKAVSIIPVVGGGIGVQFILQIVLQGSVNPLFVPWLAKADGLFSVLYKIFPGTEFAAKALSLSGTSALVNLGYFIAASMAAFVIFLLAGNFLYFKGLVGIGEEASKRKTISKDELEKRTAASTKMLSYIKKEIKQLLRSFPAFVNCIFNPVLLFPVILSIGLFSGASNDMEMLLEYIDGGLLVAIIIGVGVMSSVINPVFASVISREGSSFYFMKFIPMSIEKQLVSKMSVGIILSMIPCILLGTAFAFLGIPFGYVIAGVLCSLIIIAALAMTGAIIDIRRPKLNWTDVSRVLIMSLNYIFHVITGLVYVAIVALPIIILNWGLPIWEYEVSLAGYITYIVVVFGAVDLLLYRWINRNGKRSIMNAS